MTEIGDTGRQNQQEAASDRDRNAFLCFVFDKFTIWFIRRILGICATIQDYRPSGRGN